MQQLRQKWKSLSRMQRWSIIAACSLLIYTVFGFWLLPAIVRSQLEKKLSLALHRQTTVREVRFNPYTLEAVVSGFNIREPTGGDSFVTFDALRVNLQVLSLFKRAVIVKSFSLVNPSARIVLNSDRSLNFSDLLPAGVDSEKAEKRGGEEAGPLLFSINNIDLRGGRIDFEDRIKDAAHSVTGLHIALPFLSTLPYEIEIFTRPIFEAVVNGTPLNMAGESKPFFRTKESEIDVRLHDVDLTDYLVYLPEHLNFTIRNGRLNLDLSLSFMQQHSDGGSVINIAGKTSLRDMQLVDARGQRLLSFPELTVDIRRAHLLRREFHLAGIVWREPELFVQREEDGQFNLARLVASTEKKKERSTSASSPGKVLLEVAEAALEEATIHFTDRTVSGPMQTTMKPINLQVRNFSTTPDTSASFNLALTSESGENIGVIGAFTLVPLNVEADAVMENVRLDKYRPYYEHALRGEITADRLRAAAHVDYAGIADNLLISSLEAEMDGFGMTGPGGSDKVVIPAFSIAGTEVNFRDRTVTVDRCASRGAVIPVIRRGDGTINLQDFLAAVPADPGKPAEKAQKDEVPLQPDWQATVRTVDFADYQVTFTDRTTEEPIALTVDQLRLAAGNVTTRAGEETSLDFDLWLNGSGRVQAAGSAVLSPLALRLDANLADLPLKSVQPYVEQKLNIILTDGLVAVKGNISLDRRPEDGFAFTFLGDAGVSSFSALDGVKAERLLNWHDVRAKELDVQTGPTRIKAGELLLDGVTASVSKNAEGVLNMTTVIRKDAGREEKQEKEPPGDETPSEVNIARVRLENCRFDFADSSVTPLFKTSMEKIAGDIRGLSSSKDAAADISITAMLARHSPVRLTGAIHPWQEFFTDITAEFNDIELSPVSPYTIKFIGYPLTKGKLSLDLHYLIEGTLLTSQNRAFIDQITLGDFVQSESSVNLPVQMAISLLKNRRGEIELNIPVSGRLDDPEFSVAGVVFKMIVNLIVKAATSPFSLLGGVFSGDGQMQHIEFEAGRTEISQEAKDMLTEFAKVLYDRPAIKVELTGRVDPATDGGTLAQIRFERLLKLEKLKEPTKKKGTATDLDTIVIAADEYEYYLEKAYKAADFERPRNILGMMKDIPVEEMEALLREHIGITVDDLRELALERAGAVRDVLMQESPVEGKRIFIVEPNGDYVTTGGTESGTRVDISIR